MGALLSALLVGFCAARAAAKVPGAPVVRTHDSPAWMDEGVVIAGNWSSVTHRRMGGNVCWTQQGFGLSDVQASAGYAQEMTPAMADRLKSLGATLVILPFWSGVGGWDEERSGMEQVRRFAGLLHERGLRVGVYISEGRLSRGFLASEPDARAWLAWPTPDGPPEGEPPPDTESEGFCVYRNHPGFQAFLRDVVRLAIEWAGVDFLHFDNYVYPSGWSPAAVADFRGYMRARFTPEQLDADFGGRSLERVHRLAFDQVAPACYAWRHFQAWVLAESYRKLADYARTLRPDIGTDVNASGLRVGFRDFIDLSQLTPHGDAFWDEQARLQWDAQHRRLHTSLRSFKIGRLFGLRVFTYTADPLDLAEATAFNHDCLGCLYWFLYGRLNWACCAGCPADDRYRPQIDFYRSARTLLTEGEMIADVAVLRGRAVNLCGPQDAVESAYLFEQAMITEHLPFAIIFDQHLADLSRYRAVVLPDVRWMDDRQVAQVLRYVEQGGGLVVTGQTASCDEWGRSKTGGVRQPLQKTAAQGDGAEMTRGRGRIVYAAIERPAEVVSGSLPVNGATLAKRVRQALGGEPSLWVEAPPFVVTEFVRRDREVLVHLVDYSRSRNRPGRPARIHVSADLGRVTQADRVGPDRSNAKAALRVNTQGGCVEVGLKGLYEIIRLSLDAGGLPQEDHR